MSDLSHFDDDGRPRMVDVSRKPVSERTAIASGFVSVSQGLLKRIADQGIAKGDVIAVAELAGIMGAKRTADLIPLCHPLGLDAIDVSIQPKKDGLEIVARASTTARTGVEMEALTAVAVACLTLYDMLKSAERHIAIERIRLTEKTGGKSGSWRAE